jgi:DNA-binding CsgD family transcriptional regulator
MNEDNFDTVVSGFYAAAAERAPWDAPLTQVAAMFDAWCVQLMGVQRNPGQMAFSFEVGTLPPQAGLDYLCRYHQEDPRSALLMNLGPGEWVNCHEHFDEDYVASSPFYQDFLIPHGGRYASGTKLYQDDHVAVIWGIHRGAGRVPFNAQELGLLKRLSVHLAKATEIYVQNRTQGRQARMGLALLARLPQPVLLLDAWRYIVYANDAAHGVLDASGALSNKGGMLVANTTQDDAALTAALRSLGLTERGAVLNENLSRKVLRLSGRLLHPCLVVMQALRPEATMASFGDHPLAMMTLHDLAQRVTLDPSLVATAWGLTPAEARVACGVAKGMATDDMAQAFGVSRTTIRTQTQSVLNKTGAARQADLVSMLTALGHTVPHVD